MKTLDFSKIDLSKQQVDTKDNGVNKLFISLIIQAVQSSTPQGADLEFHRNYTKIINKLEAQLADEKKEVVLEDSEHEWLLKHYKKLTFKVLTPEMSQLVVQVADVLEGK